MSGREQQTGVGQLLGSQVATVWKEVDGQLIVDVASSQSAAKFTSLLVGVQMVLGCLLQSRQCSCALDHCGSGARNKSNESDMLYQVIFIVLSCDFHLSGYILWPVFARIAQRFVSPFSLLSLVRASLVKGFHRKWTPQGLQRCHPCLKYPR